MQRFSQVFADYQPSLSWHHCHASLFLMGLSIPALWLCRLVGCESQGPVKFCSCQGKTLHLLSSAAASLLSLVRLDHTYSEASWSEARLLCSFTTVLPTGTACHLLAVPLS